MNKQKMAKWFLAVIIAFFFMLILAVLTNSKPAESKWKLIGKEGKFELWKTTGSISSDYLEMGIKDDYLSLLLFVKSKGFVDHVLIKKEKKVRIQLNKYYTPSSLPLIKQQLDILSINRKMVKVLKEFPNQNYLMFKILMQEFEKNEGKLKAI